MSKTRLLVLLTLVPGSVFAQGADGGGHPTLNGFPVFAGWNPSAGGTAPAGIVEEPFPNLKGWDFRINVPYIRFNRARANARSGAAMVGVIEDTTFASTTLTQYKHVNNSISLFAIDANGQMVFKVLPSRRSTTSSATTNITSLTTDWFPVGPANGPMLATEKPAAAVLGSGIGSARIFLAARAADGRILMTSRLIDSETITTWTTSWQEVAPASTTRPSIAVAFGDRVAFAWGAAGNRIESRLYNSTTSMLEPMITAASASASPPVLVWDGVALDLIYTGPTVTANVWHTFADNKASYGFGAPSRITASLFNAYCDAIAFNTRLHVACARIEAGASHVWYSTSTTPFGTTSSWSPEMFVGLDDHTEPQVGTVGDELYISASTTWGRVDYARKDPHVVPFEWTLPSTVPTDHWLESSTPVDDRQGVSALFNHEVLSFNNDLYLTALDSYDQDAGLYLVNMSRAALKTLETDVRGVDLEWGDSGASGDLLEDTDPIAAMGGTAGFADINGDGCDDWFVASDGASGGPLRVSLSNCVRPFLAPSTEFLPAFARIGDTVRTGDVNGDGKADFVRIFDVAGNWQAQIAFTNSTGTGISSVVSWSAFTAFPSTASVPLIGDVDGGGRADLVVARRTATGGPVQVVLSTGSSFGTPMTVPSLAMLENGQTPFLADVNADQKMDLVAVPDSATVSRAVRVALAGGGLFGVRMTFMTNYPTICSRSDLGDFNQDAREDLVCFVADNPGATSSPRAVHVAFSSGLSFGTGLSTLISDFIGGGDLPFLANIDGNTKDDLTFDPADANRPMMDLVRRTISTGRLRWTDSLGGFPVPSGVPWERYRFSTDKGLGVAMFPEWIWTKPCLAPDHKFRLNGVGGTGGGSLTHLSPRSGSTQGHVLEELGHSVFANCIDGTDFHGIRAAIYSTLIADGGFDANDTSDACSAPGVRLAGAPVWVDCRDPQHFFISFYKMYRTRGDQMRADILATDPAVQPNYIARYNWVKEHWFNDVEYYRDATSADGHEDILGLACLPGQCTLLP